MKPKKLYTALSIAIWLLIWFVAAYFIDHKIFLPSPVLVFKAFGELLSTRAFYISILTSLRGIIIGLGIGLVLGILFAWLSYLNSFVRTFIGVFIKTIKSIPVASFVILALLWFSSDGLSILISSLIVLPIIYSNFLGALLETDPKMLEFAKVFRLSLPKKIRYIYMPATISPLISGCKVAIGYAWKSGVAAEIIGLIRNTIGNELYKAKLYLDTPKLFAWTITIILLSFICEKIIIGLLTLLKRYIGGHSNVNNNQ